MSACQLYPTSSGFGLLPRRSRARAGPTPLRVGSVGQINGRPVKVADASSTQRPDTRKNQKRYPQPDIQKAGCGFPVLKFMVLFSLCSGAGHIRRRVETFARADHRAPHSLQDLVRRSEISLFPDSAGNKGRFAQPTVRFPIFGIDDNMLVVAWGLGLGVLRGGSGGTPAGLGMSGQQGTLLPSFH